MFLGDIEEGDPALRNRAWLHVKLPGSKPEYLFNYEGYDLTRVQCIRSAKLTTALIQIEMSSEGPEVAAVDICPL